MTVDKRVNALSPTARKRPDKLRQTQKLKKKFFHFGCQAIRRFQSIKPAAYSINQYDHTVHLSYHTMGHEM